MGALSKLSVRGHQKLIKKRKIWQVDEERRRVEEEIIALMTKILIRDGDEGDVECKAGKLFAYLAARREEYLLQGQSSASDEEEDQKNLEVCLARLRSVMDWYNEQVSDHY